MYRELKIVIGIFLVYFFYALTSFFELGSFLAPFFFNKLIIVLTSLIFFFVNIRLKGSVLLFFATIGFACESLMDEFTIRFLSMRIGCESFAFWIENSDLIVITFLLFFGFLLVSLAILKYYLNNWLLLIPLLILLGLNISFIVLNEPLTSDILLNIFFLLYFAIAVRSKADEKSILLPISALFLLHALLAIFKYVFA